MIRGTSVCLALTQPQHVVRVYVPMASSMQGLLNKYRWNLCNTRIALYTGCYVKFGLAIHFRL